MSVVQNPAPVEQTVRLLRIIVLAMLVGLASFLAAALFLRAQAKVPAKDPAAAAGLKEPLPALTVASYTFAMICVPLAYVVPRLVTESTVKKIAATPERPRGNVAPLAAAYITQAIIGVALNEGPAFMAIVAYLREGNVIALFLAVALIAGVALRIPTLAGVSRWVDDQLTKVESLRRSAQFGA